MIPVPEMIGPKLFPQIIPLMHNLTKGEVSVGNFGVHQTNEILIVTLEPLSVFNTLRTY